MVESTSKPLVLITGVTSFLGSHVCLEFLKSGIFKVRGSVLDLPSKTEILQKTFGEHYSQAEFVELNFLNEEQIKKAVQDCEYIVHVGLPPPRKQPKDDKEFIDVSFKGTLFILRAAQKSNVKRVVMTSSYLTIAHSKDKNITSFNED